MFPKSIELNPINHYFIVQIIQVLFDIYKNPQNNYQWTPLPRLFLCDTTTAAAIVNVTYNDGNKKHTQLLPTQIIYELIVQLFKPSPHPVTEPYILVHSPESMVPFDGIHVSLSIQTLNALVPMARCLRASTDTPLFHPFINGHKSLVHRWFYEAGVNSYNWEEYTSKRAKLLTVSPYVSLVAYFRYSLFTTKWVLLFALVNFTKAALQKHPELVEDSIPKQRELFNNLLIEANGLTNCYGPWTVGYFSMSTNWLEFDL
jgi:hypothetical protein